MIFKLTVEKLRAKTLAQARLELEQRTLQIEQLSAIAGMLKKQIARLEPIVAEDAAAHNRRENERYARRLPVGPWPIPPRPLGGQVPPRRPPGGQVPPSEPSAPARPDLGER